MRRRRDGVGRAVVGVGLVAIVGAIAFEQVEAMLGAIALATLIGASLLGDNRATRAGVPGGAGVPTARGDPAA